MGVGITTLSITTPSITTFNIMVLDIHCNYAECDCADWCYAECHYAKCCGAPLMFVCVVICICGNFYSIKAEKEILDPCCHKVTETY